MFFFYPELIHLYWNLATSSLTHQWLLLSFTTESSENPLPLLFYLFPNLHFHFTFALLPSPPLTTCCSLLSRDVKSVPFSHFMTSVMWECMCSVSIHPAVHMAFDFREKLVFDKTAKQNTVNTVLFISHVFHLQEFYNSLFIYLFIFFMIYLFCPWYSVAAAPWDASSINLTFFILSNVFDTYIGFLPPLPYSLVQKH